MPSSGLGTAPQMQLLQQQMNANPHSAQTLTINGIPNNLTNFNHNRASGQTGQSPIQQPDQQNILNINISQIPTE